MYRTSVAGFTSVTFLEMECGDWVDFIQGHVYPYNWIREGWEGGVGK